MKKMFFFLLLSGLMVIAKAQDKDYNMITLDYTTGKLENAKTELDKLMSDPKSSAKPETMVWKYIVYSGLFADSTLKAKYPDAGKQAMDALNQYTTIDPQLTKFKDNPYSLTALNQLYQQSFNYGKNAFQKSDWSTSFENFNFCQQVSEYIGGHALNTNRSE